MKDFILEIANNNLHGLRDIGESYFTVHGPALLEFIDNLEATEEYLSDLDNLRELFLEDSMKTARRFLNGLEDIFNYAKEAIRDHEKHGMAAIRSKYKFLDDDTVEYDENIELEEEEEFEKLSEEIDELEDCLKVSQEHYSNIRKALDFYSILDIIN